MNDNQSKNGIYLRKANIEDCDLIYKWANDKVVRQNAFNTKPIAYESHIVWFSRLINDETQRQFILMVDENPVGQLRLSQIGDSIEIDYSVDSEMRGLGYGTIILNYAYEQAKKEFPRAKQIIGKVKPENAASAICFEKSGFSEKYRCYKMDL